MTGSSIFDYVHHADHNELAEYLGLGFHNGKSSVHGSVLYTKYIKLRIRVGVGLWYLMPLKHHNPTLTIILNFIHKN